MLPAATCGPSACSFVLPSPAESSLPAVRASCDRGVHRAIPRSESTPPGRHAMLFKVAVALLLIWGLGIAGVYAVGQIVHVLLLVGLMLLLLSFAKAHDAAARRAGPESNP